MLRIVVENCSVQHRTSNQEFSVIDYIKYYAYLYYLLSPDYFIFYNKLWYYFPNFFILTLVNFPWQNVDRFFPHEFVAKIEPAISEVKGACCDDRATEVPNCDREGACIFDTKFSPSSHQIHVFKIIEEYKNVFIKTNHKLCTAFQHSHPCCIRYTTAFLRLVFVHGSDAV